MKTDGYALAIPEAEIRATLAVAVQHCRNAPAHRRYACATRTIQHTLCPCALTATCVVNAVIQDFCEAIVRDEAKALPTAQLSNDCGRTRSRSPASRYNGSFTESRRASPGLTGVLAHGL